jgi:hypothetical protein
LGFEQAGQVGFEFTEIQISGFPRTVGRAEAVHVSSAVIPDALWHDPPAIQQAAGANA